MKEVRNCTRRPLRVPLPRGKVLHLNPDAIAQIADEATDDDGVREMIADGLIEIVGEGNTHPTGHPSEGPAHEDTHGHAGGKFQPGHRDR